MDYTYCPIKGCYRLGQIVFTHGFETGVNSGKFQSFIFSHEYGLLVYGHTHRPSQSGPPERVEITRSMPVNYWFANPGCLRDLKPEYVISKRTHMWGHGVIVGCSDAAKHNSRPYARTWTSQTIVFKNYEEWALGQI